jgi:hypothetical protein
LCQAGKGEKMAGNWFISLLVNWLISCTSSISEASLNYQGLGYLVMKPQIFKTISNN